MMSNSLIKFSAFTLIMISFLPLYSAEEDVKNTGKISVPINIVGSLNNLPFSHRLDDGTITGLYVDFWRLWSSTNNIPVNITLTKFADSLKMVKEGNVVQSGLFINDERQEWADFSIPIHSVNTGILYRSNDVEISSLNSLKELKVGVSKNTFQANYLQTHFPSIELVTYENLELGIELLFNGEVTAIVGELPRIKSLISSRGLYGVLEVAEKILMTNSVHAAVAKGQPELLQTINKGIENIPINQLIQLEKKWLPTLKPFFSDLAPLKNLTIAEKNWLQNHNTFSLGTESNWNPFEFFDEDGEFQGLVADYVKHVEKTLEIDLQPDKSYSWAESLEAIKRGEIDVMSGIIYSDERAKSMIFTEPYFRVQSVIVTRKNSFYVGSLADLKHRKVAMIRGYIIIDLIRIDHPNINIVEVGSISQGLEMVQNGDVVAFAGTLSVIKYELVKRQLNDLFIAGFIPYDYALAMAVRKGLEPLASILNKTIQNMDAGQKSAIANKWLSVHIQRGMETNTILIWAVPILSLLLLIIVFFVRMSNRLKHEISNKEHAEKEQQILASQLHQS